MCIVPDDIGTDAASLLLDPLPVIAREDGEDRDQLAPVHSCKDFHIEMALFDHLAHRRPVFGPKAGRFRYRHFVLRHHHRAHFMSALGVTGIGLRVNGYTVTDRELDLLAVNHFQRLALFVVVFAGERDAPSENGFVRSRPRPERSTRAERPRLNPCSLRVPAAR